MSGASIAGGVAGAIGGFMIGGPMGAVAGFTIGFALGGIMDPGVPLEAPRITDKKITTSAYGDTIGLVYGPECRISGSVIWATDLIETEQEADDGKGGGGGGGGSTYTYRMSLALTISGRKSQQVRRCWANGKLIFDIAKAPVVPPLSQTSGQTFTKANKTHSVFSELHYWPGSTVQIPDPWIEANEGAGTVPAYRGLTYIVLKDLQLADFGNRMPNLEFELVADTEISVGGVILDITNRCGLGPVSVAHLHEPLRGYPIGRNVSGAGALAPLAMAYGFDIAESTGQIRCVKRGRSMAGTIPEDQMGAHDAGDDNIDPAIFDIRSSVGLPKQATVTYSDPELDYQQGTQRAFRDKGDTEANSDTDLPLILSADEARSIADRMLWSPWMARRTAKASVTDLWVKRGPGQVVGVPVLGQVLPYRIIKATRGDNGVIEWDLQRDDGEIYNSTAEGIAGTVPPNEVILPGPTILSLIDCPIIQDSDDNSGFYWAVTAQSSGWRGAQVNRSTDGGSTYSAMADVGVRTRIGLVETALPDGPTGYWDEGNILTVQLIYPTQTLESREAESVLNGANAFWLGGTDGQDGEVIQFKTATLIAPGTYQLSGLLRGRLGTEANTATHQAGEAFVFLSSSTLGRSDFGPSDWNAPRDFKPVSYLTSIDDTDDQQFTNTGAGKKPLSPVHPLGTRNGSNDLTLTWVRRSRMRSAGLAGPVPLGELSEGYQVDFYKGAIVVRTVTTTEPTTVYTSEQQTEDGLVYGAPVKATIYQLSDVAGRGFPCHATV